MSKRTLILIVILLGVTAALLYLALSQGKQNIINKSPTTANLDYAQTTLRIAPPAPSEDASASGTYSANVEIVTGSNKVDAVQLELSYDKDKITDVDVKPGPFLQDPTELIKTINQATGTISYALSSSPTQKSIAGSGVVAIITFREIGTTGEYASINFEPKTLVTSQEIDKSVLKTATSTTFKIDKPSAVIPQTSTVPVSTAPTQ